MSSYPRFEAEPVVKSASHHRTAMKRTARNPSLVAKLQVGEKTMITRAARTLLLISSMVVAPYIVAQAGRTIPSGAEIKVRTDQAITADPASVGRTFTATVSQD